MKNNPMLKDFYELTALEVYSKKERAICDVMKQKLTALGLEVEEDFERRNGKRGRSGLRPL